MTRETFLSGLPLGSFVLGASPAMGGPDRLIAGIGIPGTPLALEATRIAQTSEPVEIFNHSLRTFLFAELLARSRAVEHDVEVVYVASILHDAGLSKAHMSKSEQFEVDGANTVRELMQRYGAGEKRIETAWDAVALHDAGGLAKWKGPEVRLVNAGVNADFGGYLSELQRSDVVAVLRAAPRARFTEVFLDAVAAVAASKPQAGAHSFVADVGYRRVPGFHLTNFCDAVQDDPFKDYAD